MWVKRQTFSTLLLISQNALSVAFIAPNSLLKLKTTSSAPCSSITLPRISTIPLHVSIGLGPGPGEEQAQKSAEEEKLVYEEPDHELYRKSRMSDFDEKCDAWFASLLGSSPSLGKISEQVQTRLSTPVELKEEKKLPPDHPQYTAYVRNLRQPWMPIVPAFGCEQYGIPIIRRMAEAWRHFDVLGMIDTDFALVPDGHGTDLILDDATAERNESLLRAKKVWLDSDSCAARLVYINGRFCPTLSKTSATVKNLKSDDLTSSRKEIIDYLHRLPDGFTDELAGAKDDIQKECGTTLLSELSSPHHNTGSATDQFAINNQQGMACFAALNSFRAGSVALVDIPENHEEEKPILIINAVTADGGVSNTVEGKGVAHHPRTLIAADKASKASIIQSTIDLDEEENDSPNLAKLHNGYTQVFLDANATILHTYVEESGGKPLANVELTGEQFDEARENESSRPGLRNTHLECIDVHLKSDNSYYKGTILGLGGCGRSKIALTTTLLKPDTTAEINGLSLGGGDQTVDMRTTIHHIAHGTTSRQNQKNMVGGRATATFKGRIRVEQSAQQTDSEQLARTLLLSDMAKIWAIPSLEIIADDVTCTHGATVSDLSEEEMFYLRSRGLNRIQSRNILMYAFVDQIGRGVDDSFLKGKGMLKDRIISRLENLVPKGDRAIKGEFSSV